MKFVGIIPARYASTRFPGKPLALINGKPMIQRVYEQCIKAKVVSDVYIATDNVDIEDHVKSFGGNVVMTSENHSNGTDRCSEVIEILEKRGVFYDVAINIQGDEPFIDPEQIEQVARCFTGNEKTKLATLVKEIKSIDELLDLSEAKVVIGKLNEAIYFSRYPIPFYNGVDEKDYLNHHKYYKHIGIYAYQTQILKELSKLEQSPLEVAESLEQLRWIENGYDIKVEFTDFESYSIDTPEDITKFAHKA